MRHANTWMAMLAFLIPHLSGCGFYLLKQGNAKDNQETASERLKEDSNCNRLNEFVAKYVKVELEPRVVPIARHFQQVRRTKCSEDGEAISEKKETVKSPITTFDLSTKDSLPEAAIGVDIINLTTCQRVRSSLPSKAALIPIFGDLYPIEGDTNGDVRVTLDMAPAVGTLQVKEGTNDFAYLFYSSCMREDGFPSKMAAGLEKEGAACEPGVIAASRLPLTIQYEETTLEGVKVVSEKRKEYGCGDD